MALFVGVDGGGTHTRAIVGDDVGRVLGRGDAGASNQATTGSASAGRAIQAAVCAALAQAGSGPGEIAAACLGLAGLDRPQDETAFAPSAEALGFPRAARLVNDSVIAWAGATGGSPGIAVIAGTGSVAYGRGANGTDRRAGGWGGVLGDEGSAYRIAAAAINRVLRGIDGREAPTGLGPVLARAAGCEDPADLCLLARADRSSPGQPLEAVIAALAPVVTEAAADGQPEAVAITEEAGRELAGLAIAIAGRLQLQAPAVHGLGSVLAGDTPVRTACDVRLRQVLGSRLLRPAYSALVGALVLAHEWGTGVLPPADVVAGWGEGR